MRYHEDCKCCGRRVTAYTEPLNVRLVRSFLKFADARLRLKRPVLKSELDLSNSEYCNFQKLRYFGLVSKLVGHDGWEMEPLGWAFKNGTARIATPAAHFGGETLPEDHLAWSTHKGKRTLVSILEVLPEEFKGRPEYADEKRGAA